MRQVRSLSRQSSSLFIMSRHLFLDASPPPYISSRDVLDKGAFKKTLKVLGARVHPTQIGAFLNAPELRRSIMDLPKIRSVVSNPNIPDGDKLLLLRVSQELEIPSDARAFLDREASGLEEHTIDLDYDYWTTEECLRAFLPEELRAEAPTGFAMTGHIAHVNLNDEYLPYKHIIGQLILDKNKNVKTVVNKLNTIDHQFRFFKMELIAGEPDYIVKHHESDCVFTFDFTQVYWNSRLHTEHERLVSVFRPEDVIADVFAGVGPFAIPAAKKGCAVLGNDLNPNSVKYLLKNVEQNKVGELVRVSCEDGRDFIRNSVARAFDRGFPAYVGRKASKMQEERERKRRQRLKSTGELTTPSDVVEEVKKPARRVISHFVMNLPDSAITFLDAFRGIFISDGPGDVGELYHEMPMIHCHCFTRESELENAKRDIYERVEEKIGHRLPEDTSLHLVRSVAPNKQMYCISFRLPRVVAMIK